MLKSPDQVARTTTFSDAVTDRSMYQAWLASKNVSTGHAEEMVIAWKLAKIINVRPGAVIRGLRGQQGQAPGLVERLRRIVDANPSIEFRMDNDGVQRTVFVKPECERPAG